ncbi:MAG: hypothetical protein Q8N36_00355 [bacterium]|nr:hypothetical protein [bacterium]
MAASLEDSIAANNPVRIIDYLVDTLDLKKLGFLNAAGLPRQASLFSQ